MYESVLSTLVQELAIGWDPLIPGAAAEASRVALRVLQRRPVPGSQAGRDGLVTIKGRKAKSVKVENLVINWAELLVSTAPLAALQGAGWPKIIVAAVTAVWKVRGCSTIQLSENAALLLITAWKIAGYGNPVPAVSLRQAYISVDGSGFDECATELIRAEVIRAGVTGTYWLVEQVVIQG